MHACGGDPAAALVLSGFRAQKSRDLHIVALASRVEAESTIEISGRHLVVPTL
jgi:hypothetical protein